MRNGQKVTEKTVPLRHGQRASRCFRKNPKNPFLFLSASDTFFSCLFLSYPFLSFLILSYPIRKTAEVKENGGRGTPSDYHYHGFTCRFGTVRFGHGASCFTSDLSYPFFSFLFLSASDTGRFAPFLRRIFRIFSEFFR